ncbi:hypothetical protein BG000_003932 [Podila horticola]|nr:hypothetical protein BG000_003932 [Podila horticola]
MPHPIHSQDAGVNYFQTDQMPEEDWPDYADYSKSDSDQESVQEHDDGLGPEVYGDFLLAPLNNIFKPVSKHATKTDVANCTYRRASPSSRPTAMFVPPEIIRIVFSYCDEAVLCRVLRLVCRSWYHLAKSFIRLRGEWRFSTQKAEDTLLEKLHARQVHDLCLHYNTGAESSPTTGRVEPYNNEDSAWLRFFISITNSTCISNSGSTLKSPSAGAESADPLTAMVLDDLSSPQRCLLDSVRKVFVTSKVLWAPILLPSLLPYFGRIQSLELCKTGLFGSISVFTILDHCHCLHELTISGPKNLPDEMMVCCQSNMPTLSTTSGFDNVFGSYPLKRFSADGVAFELKTLQCLIKSCPQMREFIATDICIWIFQGRNTIKVPLCDTYLHLDPLYRLAADHCPNLIEFSIVAYQSSHLYHTQTSTTSNIPSTASAEVLQHLRLTIELFPHITVATLPTVVGGLWDLDRNTCLYLSRLTHLTITHSLLCVHNMDKLLRCARSLVSLIAPRSSFSAVPDPLQIEAQFQDILTDVHEKRHHLTESIRYHWIHGSPSKKLKIKERICRRLERQGMATRGDLPHPTRWMCKHLQTLDIGVHAFVPRGLFAHLARSCPRLVNLTLRMSVLYFGQRLHTIQWEIIHTVPPKKAANRWRPWRKYPGKKQPIRQKKDIFTDMRNDLLALCGDRTAGEAPRLVHLKRLEILTSAPGLVCTSDFDFLGKDSSVKDMPWPVLELFIIVTGAKWTIVDHPRAAERGEETVESLTAKVRARRPRLELQLL